MEIMLNNAELQTILLDHLRKSYNNPNLEIDFAQAILYFGNSPAQRQEYLASIISVRLPGVAD
jgi:hypothetical protein